MAETFVELNVADTLVHAAEAAGFSKPTALQQRLVPVILGGADVLLQARSGGGRSVAYLMPMMQRLLERDALDGRGPRALILAASRDAAMKIGRTIKDLGHDSPLRFGTVVGGRPYPMQHQLLRRPLDILVATPSRLMDHIRRGRVPFERLEMLVVDRADEMLEMGLDEDLRFIAEASPEQRQTLLLAGNVTEAVAELSSRLQKEPLRIEVDAAERPEPSSEVAEATPQTPREGRRRSRSGRGPHARKARGHKSGGDAARRGGEVNGNVMPAPKAKEKQARNKPAKAGKAGARGPGRRAGGSGRRPSDVRFPSDYANGPHVQPAVDPVEKHREVKRHEPMQYLADYGFSSGPRARKPVTVVYRNKGRKSARREELGSGDEES